VFSKDMSQSQSGSAINLEKLNQLLKAELVEIILTQHKLIEELRIEIENLTCIIHERIKKKLESLMQ
jgi:hypothetical protein